MPAWARRWGGFAASRRGFLQRTASALLLCALFGLLLIIPSVSSETESQSPGNKPLYSDWQEGSLDGESGLSLEDLLDEGAAQPESADFNVGSFSLHRPQSELFMKGLLGEAYDIAVGAAVENDELESYLQSRARARIMDTTVPDFQTWLTSRSEGISERIFLNSADYLTDYLTASVVDSAEGLNFVRTIEWDYQSTLGERRWQTGLSALGALRESNTDAIAWQLRGYAAEDSGTGANVGLIYRRVTDSAGSGLLGLNVFLDYEKHGDYDEDFLRWSVGGEYRNAYLDIYLNRYFPISDAVLQDGDYVYTQGGQEAYINLKAPDFGIGQVSGGLTYYQWEGEYGDADDKGFRYHIGFSPQRGNLNLEVELDSPDGGDVDWGGRVSYRHIIGSADRGNASASAADFDARSHFFDSVRREYAQRIRNSGEAARDALVVGVIGGEDGSTGTVTIVVLENPPSEATVTVVELSVTANPPGEGDDGDTYTLKVSQPLEIRLSQGTSITLSASAWQATVLHNSTVKLSDSGSRFDVVAGTVLFTRTVAGLNTVHVGNMETGTTTIALSSPRWDGEVGLSDNPSYSVFIRIREGEISLTVTTTTDVNVDVVGASATVMIVLVTSETDPPVQYEVGCATPAQRDAHRRLRSDFAGCPADVRVGSLGEGQEEVLHTQGQILVLQGVAGGNVAVVSVNGVASTLNSTWEAYPFHAGGSTLHVEGAPVALSYGQDNKNDDGRPVTDDAAELVVALDSTVAFSFVDAAIAATATQAVSIYAAIEGGAGGAISDIGTDTVGCATEESRASEGLVSVVAVCGAPSFADGNEHTLLGRVGVAETSEFAISGGGGDYRFELTRLSGGGSNILQLASPTGAVAMVELDSDRTIDTDDNVRYRLRAIPNLPAGLSDVGTAAITIVVEVVDEFTAQERNMVVATVVTELGVVTAEGIKGDAPTVIHTVDPIGALGAVSYALAPPPATDPYAAVRARFNLNTADGAITLASAIPAADIATGVGAVTDFPLIVEITDAGSTPPAATLVTFTVQVRHPSGHVASDVVTVGGVQSGDYRVYRTDATGDILTFSNTRNAPDNDGDTVRGILAGGDYTYTPTNLPSGFEFTQSGTNDSAAQIRIDSNSPPTAGEYDIDITVDDDHSLTNPFVVNAKISIVAPLELNPATGEANVNLAAANPIEVADVGAVTFNGGHGDKTYALDADNITPAGARNLFAVNNAGVVTFTSNPAYSDSGPNINVPIVVSDDVGSATYVLEVTAHAALNVPNRVVPRQVVDKDHTADFHTPAADSFIAGGKKPYKYKLETGAVSSTGVNSLDNADFTINESTGALRLAAAQTAPAMAEISVAVEGDAGGATYYKLTVEITDDVLLTPDTTANPPENPAVLDIGYNDSGVIARILATWLGGATYGSFTYALDPDTTPNPDPDVSELSVDSNSGNIVLSGPVSRSDSSEVRILATPTATNFNFSGVDAPTLMLNLNFHERVSFTNLPDVDDIVRNVLLADNPAPAEADRDDNALYTFMVEGGSGSADTYVYSIVSGDEGIVAFSDSTNGALVQVGAVNGLAAVGQERELNLVVRVTDADVDLGGSREIDVKVTWRRVDDLTVTGDGTLVGTIITQVNPARTIHNIQVVGEKGVVSYALADDPANDPYAALRPYFTVNANSGIISLTSPIPANVIAATGQPAAITDMVDFPLVVEVTDDPTDSTLDNIVKEATFMVKVRHPSGHVASNVNLDPLSAVKDGDYAVYSQDEARNILTFTNTRNLPDSTEGVPDGGNYTYTDNRPAGFVLTQSGDKNSEAVLSIDNDSPPTTGKHDIEISVDDGHSLTDPVVAALKVSIVEPLELNPASHQTNVNLAAAGAIVANINAEKGYGNKNYVLNVADVTPAGAAPLLVVHPTSGEVLFSGSNTYTNSTDDINAEIVVTDQVGGEVTYALVITTHPPLVVADNGVVPTQAVDKDFTDSFHTVDGVGGIVSSGRTPYTYEWEVESAQGLDETDFDITGGELSLAEAQTTVPAMAEVTVTVTDAAFGVTMYTVPVEIVDVVFTSNPAATPPVNPTELDIDSGGSGLIAAVNAALSGTATDYGAFTYAIPVRPVPDVEELSVDSDDGEIRLSGEVTDVDGTTVTIVATPPTPTPPNLSGVEAETFTLTLHFEEAVEDVTFTDPPERIVRGVASGAVPSGAAATLATFAAAGGTGDFVYSIESGNIRNVDDTGDVLAFSSTDNGALVQVGAFNLTDESPEMTLDLMIKVENAGGSAPPIPVQVIWRKVDGTTNADKRFYLLGGFISSSAGTNDVWATNEGSTEDNGTRWTQIASSAFPTRLNHAAAELDGTLFVSGGTNGNNDLSDVWASGDNGFNWSQMMTLNADSPPEPEAVDIGGREGHAMVNYGGTLHIIGGNAAILYSSEDGQNWAPNTEFDNLDDATSADPGPAVAGKFSARSEMAVVEHKGELYIIGGAIGTARTAGIYKTTKAAFPAFTNVVPDYTAVDGTTPPASAPFRRTGAQALSFGNRIYLIGGDPVGRNSDNTGNTFPDADVWSSQDGITWELETSDPAFGNLSNHVAYVKEGLMFVASGTTNDGTNVVDTVWRSSNGVDWEQVTTTDAFGGRRQAAAIVHQPAVRVNGPAAEDIAAAVSPSPAGGDLLVVTVARGFGAAGAAPVVAITPANPYFTLASGAPDASPLIITVRQARGVGIARTAETFNIVATQTDFGTDTFSGAVTWTEKAATEFAPVLPNAHLFVIGGDGFNDVWTSADGGVNWRLLTESLFSAGARDGAAVAVISNTVYISGGGATPTDEVYSSDNGVDWNLVTDVDDGNTEFLARKDHAMLAYDNDATDGDETLFVIGGVDGANALINDVWYSTDYGVTWTRTAVAAGKRFSARRNFAAFVHDDTMFVAGGQIVGDAYTNEVWASADGADWTMTGSLPFAPSRSDFNAVSYKERIYLSGGLPASNNGVSQEDVWTSVDGKTWELVTNDGGFVGLAEHGMVAQGDASVGDTANGVRGNRMFLLGGRRGGAGFGDVWSSTDGINWEQETAFGQSFSIEESLAPRVNLAAAVFKPALGLPVPGAVVESKAPHTIGTPLLTLLANGGDLGGNSPAEAYRYDIVNDSGAVIDIVNIGINGESGVLSIKQAATDTAIEVVLTVQVTNRVEQNSAPSSGVITFNLTPPAAEALAQLVIIGGLSAGSADGTAAESNQVWTSADGSSWSPKNDPSTNANVFDARKQLAAVEMGGTIYISGGRTEATGSEETFADVWASIDGGENWVQRADGRFPARYNHQMLIHDGSLFIVGGVGDDDILNDAWHSADGAAWEALEVTAGGELGNDRNYFAAFSDNNFLIVAGGHADTRARFYNVVDPSDPTKSKWDFSINELNPVGLIAFNPSQDGPAAGVTLNEGLYLFFNNTVFQSSDGSTGGWEAVDPKVTGDADPFYYYAAAAHNGKIYVSGGADADNNLRNDVWSWSAVSGEAWQVGGVVDSNGYYFRDHAMVSYPPGAAVTPIPPFVPSSALQAVAAPTGVEATAPSTAGGELFRVNVSGGTPPYTYAIDGVSIDNIEARAANNVDRGNLLDDPDTDAPDAAATDYVTVAMDETDNAVGIVMQATAVANPQAGTVTVEVTDDAGDTVQALVSVGWAAPSTEEVESAYPPVAGLLFVIGGQDSNTQHLSDVWASGNGSAFGNAPLTGAAFGTAARSRHAVAVLSNTIYVSGGVLADDSITDEVWSSADGVNWTLRSTVSGEKFSSRRSHAMVAYKGTLYVLGGRSPADTTYGDIWYSDDEGVNWSALVLSNNLGIAGAGRQSFAAAVHNGSLFVIGGTDATHNNNILALDLDKLNFASDATGEDRSTWITLRASVPVDPPAGGGTPGVRNTFSALSFQGKLYFFGGLLGGLSSSAQANVWSSVDGRTWKRETDAAAFGQRAGYAAAIHSSSMFILGGSNEGGNLLTLVHSSGDGAAWTAQSGRKFGKRRDHAAAVIVPKLVLDVPSYVAVQGRSGNVLTLEPLHHGQDSLPYIYSVENESDLAGINININGADFNIKSLYDINEDGVFNIQGAFATAVDSELNDQVKIVFRVNDPEENSAFDVLATVTFILGVDFPADANADIEVPFNAVAGRVLTTFAAEKGSAAENYSYEIVSGNGDDRVSLNAASGVLTQKGAAPPVAGTQVVLVIRVTDSETETSDTITVTVRWVEEPGPLFVIGGDGHNDVWVSTNEGTDWGLLTDSLFADGARDGAVAVATGGTVYAFGGKNSDELFSSNNGVDWELVNITSPSRPSARSGHAMFSFGTGFILIGGEDSAGNHNTDQMWAFSRTGPNEVWTENIPPPGLTARSEMVALSRADGAIFILGGKNADDTYSQDVWFRSGAEWEGAANGKVSLPFTLDSGTSDFDAVLFNENVYLFQGNRVWVSEDALTSWSSVGQTQGKGFDSGLSGYEVLVRGDEMFVLGGTPADSDGKGKVWSSADGASWTLKTAAAGTDVDKKFPAPRVNVAGAVFVPQLAMQNVPSEIEAVAGTESLDLPEPLFGTAGSSGYSYSIKGFTPTDFDTARSGDSGALLDANGAFTPDPDFITALDALDSDELTIVFEVSDGSDPIKKGSATVVFGLPAGTPVTPDPDDSVGDGVLLVIGGRSQIGLTGFGGESEQVWASNRDKDSWTRIDRSLPANSLSRFSHAAATLGGTIFVSAGRRGSGRLTDVWASKNNGVNWSLVGSVDSRAEHAMVNYGGTLHVIGGGADGTFIQSSGNGENWTQNTAFNSLLDATAAKPEDPGPPLVAAVAAVSGKFSNRNDMAVVEHNGELYVIGGVITGVGRTPQIYKTTKATFPKFTDVTGITDANIGATQTTYPWRRDGAQAVSFNNGTDNRIYLIGGRPYNDAGTAEADADVWSSVDGAAWTRETPDGETPPFGDLSDHVAYVQGNAMFVAGGGTRTGLVEAKLWKSTDGKTWTEVALAADGTFPQRANAAGVALALPSLEVSAPANVVVNFPAAADGFLFRVNAVNSFLASKLSYEFITNPSGAPSNAMNDEFGNIFYTTAVGTALKATVTVKVTDKVSGDSDTVETIVDWVAPSSPERVLVIGGQVAGKGESNDIYASEDGTNWAELTQDSAKSGDIFPKRIGHAAAALGGTVYVSGGDSRVVGDLLNDVWASADGAHWTLRIQSDKEFNDAVAAAVAAGVTPPADEREGFPRRRHHKMVAHNGTLFVIGGAANGTTGKDGEDPLSDVWVSTDGIAWTQSGADNVLGHARDSFLVFSHNGALLAVAGNQARDQVLAYNDRGTPDLTDDTWDDAGTITGGLVSPDGNDDLIDLAPHGVRADLLRRDKAFYAGAAGAVFNGKMYILARNNVWRLDRPSSSSVSTEREVPDTYNCIADSELVGHKAVQLGDQMLVIGGIDSKLGEFRGAVQSDVWASAANNAGSGWTLPQRHPGFRARHDHAVVAYRPIIVVSDDNPVVATTPLPNPPAPPPLTLGHPCDDENVKTNTDLELGKLFRVQASGGADGSNYSFEIVQKTARDNENAIAAVLRTLNNSHLTVVPGGGGDSSIMEVHLSAPPLPPLPRNTRLDVKVKVTKGTDTATLTVPVPLVATTQKLALDGPFVTEVAPPFGSDLRRVEVPIDPNSAECRDDWSVEACPKKVVYISSSLRPAVLPIDLDHVDCQGQPGAPECPREVVYIEDEESYRITNLDRAAKIKMQGRLEKLRRLESEGQTPSDEQVAHAVEVGPTKLGAELFRVRSSGGSGYYAQYKYEIDGVNSDNALDGNGETDNENKAYFNIDRVSSGSAADAGERFEVIYEDKRILQDDKGKNVVDDEGNPVLAIEREIKTDSHEDAIIGAFARIEQAELVDRHATVTVTVIVTDGGEDGNGTEEATLTVKVEMFPTQPLALEGYHYPPGEELPRIAIIPRRSGQPCIYNPVSGLCESAPELLTDNPDAQYYGVLPLGNFEPSPRYPQRERKIYQGAARFDLPAPQANDEELLELLRVQATGKEKSAGGYDLNIVAAAFIRDGERPDDDPDIVVDYGDRIEAVVAEDAPNFIGEDNSNLFIIRLKDNTLPKLNDKNERLSIHLKVSNGGTEDEDTVTMKVEINLLPPAAESEQAAPLGVLVIGGRGNNNENDPRQVNNILFFDAVTTFKWKQLSPAADFSPRSGHAAAVLDGTVYISGGVSIRFVAQGEPLVTTSLDEVWYSDDFGVNWSLNTGTPFPARSSHKMIEHDGTLFVIGGVDGDGEILNDIWTSTDGANWTKSAATLDNDRESFMAFVYKGTLMVAGGRNVADTTAKEAVTEVNRAFRAYDTKGTKVVSDDIVLTLTATRAGDVVTTPAALPPLPNNLYITARANNPDSPQGAPLDPHNSDKSVGAAAAVFNDTIIIYARNHIWHTDGTTWTRSTTQAPYSYLYHNFGAVRPTRSADSVRRVGHLPVVRSDEEGDDTSLVLIGGTGHSSTGTLDEGSTIWPSGNGIAFADAPAENLPGSFTLGGSEIRRYGHAVVALNPKVVKTEPEMPTEETDTRPLFVIGGDNRNDVWVSEDNGAGWKSLTEELFPGSARSGIAVAVVDGITTDDTPASDNDRVYVSSADADGRLEEVRTSQTGVDWTVVELDNNGEFPSISGYAMLPFYNSEVQYNEGFVLIGGKDASDDYLNDVWKYDAHNGFFNKMDDAPFTGRSDFVALVHQEGGVDVFFVMGGVTDDDNDGTTEQSNEVWAGTYGATGLDRFDLEWETTKRSDLPFTPNGDDFNAVSFGGEIYLFNDNDIWKSTDGKDWGSPMTDAAPFSDIDDYTVLARAGDKIYVLGGSSGAGEVWSTTNGTDWTEETENTAAGRNFLAPRTNGVAAAFEPSFRLIAPARVQISQTNETTALFTLTAAWGEESYQYAFGTITPNDFDSAHALIQLADDGAVSGAAGLHAAINGIASGEVTVQFYVTDGGGAGYIAPVVEVVFWVEKSSALFNVNPNTGTETVAADYASADDALSNPFHTPADGLVTGGSGVYEYAVAGVKDDDATNPLVAADFTINVNTGALALKKKIRR